MRSPVLTIVTVAAALSLPGCGTEDGELNSDASTGTTETPTTAEDPSTDDGTPDDTTTDDPSTTTTDADESSSEGSSSTGEPEVTCPYDDPGWQSYEPGLRLPHLELTDHTGEIWRACEHYGAPMVIDTSAAWCGPCQALSAFMAGNDEAVNGIFLDPVFIQDFVFPFRDYVNAGCINWVTVLTQNAQGGPPSQNDAEIWDLQYHNPNIPVIADPTGDFETWLDIQAYPTTFLINNDFTYLTNDLSFGIELVIDNLECDLSGMDGGE
ncbi:MAG: hypothetical protein AAGF11_44360 [Myxococcota bacterium]